MATTTTQNTQSDKQFESSHSKKVCTLVLISMLSSSLCLGSNQQAYANRRIALVNQATQSTPNKSKVQLTGQLVAMLPSGEIAAQCPLTHTDVTAQISGYVSKVKVKQIFENTSKETIEAVYTFPLSDTGAVDEMEMQIGKRKIKGTIKKRAEAREIYNQARSLGHTASLLDQERTNIFTQSVANIPAGAKVEITLQYVETLPFENGKFSFVFPTVVGPRFIPGQATGHSGSGRENDTDQVPDASLITPPVTPDGTRSGHDISINISLKGGMPIDNINSKLHEIKVDRKGNDSATITLIDKNTIPNKDFVLNWDVAGSALKSGYLTHKDSKDKSGYFTLMLVPPKNLAPKEIAPKEMIFLIDCSGSQRGLPLQKAKETLSYVIDHMNTQDTFQVIAFNSTNTNLFEKPQAVSNEMKEKAQAFIKTLEANGSTYAAPAVEAACAIPADDHRLRIVTFMTDGFIGNDMEVVGMIHKMRGTSRWFTFGTGNSVNRALINEMAVEGGGEADYVLLNSSGAEVGKKFYDHISSPVLTDVKIDFGSLQVKDVSPREVFDVWAQRPLYFKGRYEATGSSTVTLSGFAAGKPYKQTLSVTLPAQNTSNDALGSIWARAQVDKLMREDMIGAQRGQMKKELQDEVTNIALKHHIMTQFTSFVAVDESSNVTPGDKKIVVPTEMADGVSREATLDFASRGSAPSPMHLAYKVAGGGNYFAAAMHAPAAPMPMMRSYSSSAVNGVREPLAQSGRGKSLVRFEKSPQLASAATGPQGADATSIPGINKASGAFLDQPKTKDTSKFESSLKNLIAIREKANDLSQKILVSIKFTCDETTIVEALKILGVTPERQSKGGQVILGKATIEQLKKIALLKDVISISLSQSVSR